MQQSVFAQAEDSISVPLSETDRPEEQKPPRKGNRMPSMKEVCVIDFSSKSISSSIGLEIVTYELWNEAGEYIVTSTFDDTDMVDFLSTIKGSYQLHIVTEYSVYFGYIEL